MSRRLGARTNACSGRSMAIAPRNDSSEKPTCWIVAGPNGSGKSSLYGNTDIEAFDQSIWIINPDLLTRRIQQVEQLSLLEANLQAVRRIEDWLQASIEAHQTVG